MEGEREQQQQSGTEMSFYSPPKDINRILIQHVMWVNDVAQTYGHLFSLLVINKSVGEDSLG